MMFIYPNWCKSWNDWKENPPRLYSQNCNTQKQHNRPSYSPDSSMDVLYNSVNRAWAGSLFSHSNFCHNSGICILLFIVFLLVCLVVSQLAFLPVPSSLYLSWRLSFNQSGCLSIFLSVCLFVHLSKNAYTFYHMTLQLIRMTEILSFNIFHTYFHECLHMIKI